MTIRNIAADAEPALAVGAEIELAFSDLLANGQAVGRIGGLVLFCFGPLPQERARVRITAIKPRYAVGELVGLTIQSPFRAQPFCTVFGVCGGCQLQHLTYSAQLAWKRDAVKNALQRIGAFPEPAVRDAVGMVHPRAYRNKMSLVVATKNAAQRGSTRVPVLGFYKQRSHDVVQIPGCPIVMPQLDAHIGTLTAASVQPAFAQVFAKTRHIVERSAKSTEQSVVTFTTAQPSEELRAAAPSLMNRLSGTVGITNSFDLSSENAIVGRKHAVVAGTPQIEERLAELRYRVSAGSFFQVNVEIVGRIFEFMRAQLNAPGNIVDLYCGAGAFSLFFAKLGNDVLGVEGNTQAIAEARDNARLNQLESMVRFVCARVEQAVRRADVQEALRNAQIAFLDPPRKGSDEATLGAVASAGVPNIWYLSCDPATLARDLKFLAAKGYGLGAVQPFDMFPQTGHVETLVMMYRENRQAAEVRTASGTQTRERGRRPGAPRALRVGGA